MQVLVFFTWVVRGVADCVSMWDAVSGTQNRTWNHYQLGRVHVCGQGLFTWVLIYKSPYPVVLKWRAEPWNPSSEGNCILKAVATHRNCLHGLGVFSPVTHVRQLSPTYKILPLRCLSQCIHAPSRALPCGNVKKTTAHAPTAPCASRLNV